MIPRFKPFLNKKEFKKIFSFKKNSVTNFEKGFSRVFNSVDTITFPYGRSAEWAFFKALDIKNTEVIMPAYTCSVVAYAVSLSQNIPRFIDINLSDYNMDLDILERSINEKTSAIITTHTFGYPQDMGKLKEIILEAEKRFNKKIWLINDCCHAFGAKWNGQLVGNTGDVAIYAFNISKLITCVFGGALTFQDKELATKVRTWRDKNFAKPSIIKSLKRRLYLFSIFIAFNPNFYKITWLLQNKTSILDYFTKKYHLDSKIEFPKDSKILLTNFEASIGIEQLYKYQEIIKERKIKALKYKEKYKHIKDWIMPPIREGATYSHYVVRVPNRDFLIKKFSKKDIEIGKLIDYSIPELSCYKYLKSNCPNAEKASKSVINLPM